MCGRARGRVRRLMMDDPDFARGHRQRADVEDDMGCSMPSVAARSIFTSQMRLHIRQKPPP